MKKSRLMATLATALCVAGMPLAAMGSAAAESNTQNLRCYSKIQIESETNNQWNEDYTCDLGLTKDVSVNDGAFVAADTADAAPTAHVGDTLTWKVTLSDLSSDSLVPYGQVTISDVLPTNVSLVSAVASSGDFTDNVWTVSLSDTLPATLTVTTKATTVGQVVNTATITGYTACSDNAEVKCDDPAYSDDNNDNNSNSAYVNVVAVPVVVTPSVPHTGFGITTNNSGLTIAAFGAISAALGAAAFISRRALQK